MSRLKSFIISVFFFLLPSVACFTCYSCGSNNECRFENETWECPTDFESCISNYRQGFKGQTRFFITSRSCNDPQLGNERGCRYSEPDKFGARSLECYCDTELCNGPLQCYNCKGRECAK